MRAEVIAGTISTTLFAMGNVPMLLKASRTRSLASYSHGHLMLNGTANVFHWVYVSALPLGPIWFLHGFHTISTGLMLTWYFRYEQSHMRLTRERLLAWLGRSRRLGAQRAVGVMLLLALAVRVGSPVTRREATVVGGPWLASPHPGAILKAAADHGEAANPDGRGRQGCGPVVSKEVSPWRCSPYAPASRRSRAARSASASSWRREKHTG